MNYFWDLNINNAPANRDLLRYYADYYEHLLRAYPCLRDSYSILGYSYHYLGDDQKAEDYLIKAIHYDPAYAWNYYNLASLYINHSRYPEALQMLQRLEKVDPQLSLTKMFSSYLVFFPLLSPGGHDALSIVSQHLKATYRACAVLEDQLNLIPEDKDVERMVKKMNLELYAF